MVFALILTGCLTVIGMVAPLLMRRLINDVAREGNWDIFPMLMGLMFAVPLLRAVVNIGTSITLNQINLGIIGRTRKRIFHHLMRLSMDSYSQMPVGGMQQRLMGDVATLSGVATGGIISLLADGVAVVFAVVVMLRLSLPLSMLTFALLPAYFLNYWFFSKRIRTATALLRSRMDHISSTLQERLSAHELIQSYGQDRAEATHFTSQARQVMDAAIRGSVYSTSFNHLATVINQVGNTLIFCAGAYMVIQEQMGYGDVVAFCAYATNILGPVTRFAGVSNQLVQAGVSADRINELMHREPAIRESEDPEHVETLEGDIRLDAVTFSYPEGRPALHEVTLSIPAGTHVAVVGAKGAGRSTLAMLLRRFYDPQEGLIAVDGTDIRRYHLREYRRAMAMVRPESAIFDGSIADNLRYGKPDVSDERMIEVSRALGLDEFVSELHDGYGTLVGTGGLQLSTGVRQKIGMARALIADPLMLILDEAVAALDAESAETAIQAVLDAMDGRTCIIVINRVLMARGTDRVVVMERGRVAQIGEHAELLVQAGSIYRDLFASQYGRDRLPPLSEE